jgi:E3 ubiquitin-protein ligase HUWE1
MNRFEQLIEYVINDEEHKARELFHDIVVAKSREIYESLMQEEDLADADEEEAEEELDESAEEFDEGAMGGDASDDLIDEVETEESADMSMEAEGDDEEEEEVEVDFGDEDMGSDDDHATKDDIMNLEDKLDQLMAEFESAMGGDDMGSDGDDFGPEEGGDAIEMDDTEEMMSENITLKQVHPKTTTSEEGDGKAGPVAFNAGAAGMAAKPVKATGTEAQGRPAPTTKDLVGKVGNSPAQGTQGLKPAAKPHLSQATGVNTKSPLPGRKG